MSVAHLRDSHLLDQSFEPVVELAGLALALVDKWRLAKEKEVVIERARGTEDVNVSVGCVVKGRIEGCVPCHCVWLSCYLIKTIQAG